MIILASTDNGLEMSWKVRQAANTSNGRKLNQEKIENLNTWLFFLFLSLIKFCLNDIQTIIKNKQIKNWITRSHPVESIENIELLVWGKKKII